MTPEEKNEEKDALLVKKIKAIFGASIIETVLHKGEVTHVVEKNTLLDISRYLKSERAFAMNYLVDISGVDYLEMGRRPRFDVVYHLLSIPNKLRIRIKIRVDEGETVPTLTTVWKGANWHERETFDMFGIVFEGHPDLRRIYLPQDWEGFPLRKDYPLRGYKDKYNPFGQEKG